MNLTKVKTSVLATLGLVADALPISPGRIPGVLKIFNHFYGLMRPKGMVLVEAQGSKMYVSGSDNLASSLISRGIWESYETSVVRELVKPMMTVVDVGANIGYYALLASRLTGEKGEVYAFEPEPSNYKILAKNIELNKYGNIVAINKAISNESGMLTLYCGPENLAISSISEKNVRIGADCSVVEATTLDGYFGDRHIDLLMVDVEGAESLVFQGARQVLNNTDKMIIEFWPYGQENVGTDPSKFLELLVARGFSIKVIDGKRNCLSEMLPDQIISDCLRIKNGRGHVDLLLEKATDPQRSDLEAT